MKYGYENVENEVLIQSYKTSDDKIVITFLDGSNFEIPLTKENETDLLNQMLKQAQDRSQSSALDKAKRQRKKTLIYAGINLIILGTISVSPTHSNVMGILANIFSHVSCIMIGIDGVLYKFKRDEIKELEKYDIYLAMREALEKNSADTNLFKGIKSQQEKLNINTLDNYSLNDIKTIQSNLKRIQYFTDTSDTPKVKRKLCK